jgi:pilus assembly protein CpaF
MANEIEGVVEPLRRRARSTNANAKPATPAFPEEISFAASVDAAPLRPASRSAVKSLMVIEQQRLKSVVHQELIARLDLDRLDTLQDTRSGQQQLLAAILQIIGEQGVPLSGGERETLAREVLDEVLGLGPLEPLLQDDTISDILVNTYSQVYVERKGVLELTNIAFKDNHHLLRIIDKIVSAVDRRIDESSPMVDARLKDGSRVNAIIPPLAVDGPALSIRRFGSTPLTADDLLRNKALSPPMLQMLRGAVQGRLNIVISGGTGSGKTTLLNVLSGFISSKERILTIEDSAELQLKQRHVVRLECRPPNVEGTGAVRQRELVINALRMRPDRIVLGEVRGGEALDMLQAMNTGHDGSITTIHANSPRDALARLETMSMMGDVRLPDKAIQAQIASAIHLIVQVARMSDGTRRVTHISELTGNYAEVISMQDLFLFEKQGLRPDGRVKGFFHGTGIVPRFGDSLKAAGIAVPGNAPEQTMEV